MEVFCHHTDQKRTRILDFTKLPRKQVDVVEYLRAISAGAGRSCMLFLIRPVIHKSSACVIAVSVSTAAHVHAAPSFKRLG